MALTIGTDTYIEVVDADSYVQRFFVSQDEKRTSWEVLSEADKEVYLRKAATRLDQLPYMGQKAGEVQVMAFPRSYYRDGWWETQDAVPDEVTHAQVEEALAILMTGTEETMRESLQQQGVTSYRIGDLQENLSGRQGMKLLSVKAMELLARYLNGTYHIKAV